MTMTQQPVEYRSPIERDALAISQELGDQQPADPPAPTQALAVDIALPNDGRWTAATTAYRIHRPAGVRKALAQAWQALARRPFITNQKAADEQH
jgi:hypothetical protein